MSRLSAHIEEGRAAEGARRQADQRGVPASIMMPRILLAVATFLLVLLGLVMVFSASTVESISQGESIFSYVSKQFAFVILGGLLAFVIVKWVPYYTWLNGVPFWALWLVCILMIVAVPIIGTEILGAKRWIFIGGMSVQPTEFLKIALVAAGANVLYRYKNEIITPLQMLVAAFILVVGPLLFMFSTQSDMGSTLIIVMGLFSAMWLGEVPLRVLLPLVLAAVCGAAFALAGYRMDRIQVWLDPWNDGEGGYGTGYQMIRSYYAFAQGGLFGVGLGNSREKFLYLPEAETDFIFAVIGEELGLVGAFAVIALFLVVLYSGLAIARNASEQYGRILAGSLTAMLVGQAFLNIACAIGAFPVTGKPLPFISSGGSSVISSLMTVGIILSVSKGSNTLTPHERRRNDLNVIRVEYEDDDAPDERTRFSRDRRARASASTGASLLHGAVHVLQGTFATPPARSSEGREASSRHRDEGSADASQRRRGAASSERSSREARTSERSSSRGKRSGSDASRSHRADGARSGETRQRRSESSRDSSRSHRGSTRDGASSSKSSDSRRASSSSRRGFDEGQRSSRRTDSRSSRKPTNGEGPSERRRR